MQLDIGPRTRMPCRSNTWAHAAEWKIGLCAWVLMFGCLCSTHALTPPPDTSPRAFAGEWAGTGAMGSYCHVQLGADGRGRVLVDGGSGDWLGARIEWRNRRGSLQVDKVVPAAEAPRLRIMPLETMVLHSGFNQSLNLSWNAGRNACELQRVETTARRLERARTALEEWQAGEGRR